MGRSSINVAPPPPTPPAGVVTSGGLAIISKIPKHHTRSLFLTHPHTRLHFSTSASFLQQSSFFSAIALKGGLRHVWLSGLQTSL